MDELNMQMDEAAASAQELEATYSENPTVVIYEGHQTTTSVQHVDSVAVTTASAPSTNVSSDLKSKFWTHEATLLLIELYKSYQETMKDPRIKKKDVWNRIASDMAANGFQFHGDMCDKKWRNLKKSYLSVLESKSVQGQTRRLWQYFDILNDVFSKETNSTDAVATSIGIGGDNDDANETLLVLNNAGGRSASSSSSKMGKSRAKISILTTAPIVSPVSNVGMMPSGSIDQPNEQDVVLGDGALEDMSSVQALKVLLERQERSEERRMNHMMEELRKMHDENLEVMHERNVLLHRLIEQLSSGT